MPELVPNHKKKILLWKHRNKNLFYKVLKKNICVEVGSAADPI